MSENHRSSRYLVAGIFAFVITMTAATSVKAQTALATGDLAFSGYISNDVVADRFSFVLLKAVSANTVIKFTDFGWRPNTLTFDAGINLESEITFTTSSALPAGTEIMITGSTAIIVGSGSAGTVAYSSGGSFVNPLSLTSTGDQILAYQGTFASPQFIAGIHMNVYSTAAGDPSDTTAAAWDGILSGSGLNSNSSGKPAALTTGTNALWFSTEFDNARFTCGPNVSTAPLALAALNNPANWQANNSNPSGLIIPTGCGYLGLPTAANGSISGRITDDIGQPIAGVAIRISGTQSRLTITNSDGQYRFENVATGGFYTITPTRENYDFSPAQRSFSQVGNGTEAAFTAASTGSSLNPLDTPEYFVRQHYLDFLGREPDEAGFNFWSDQISSCGNDAACIERRTINVSAAYFLSIEFQQTGGLVDGLYRASYGRAPHYAEFMPDAAAVARNVIVGSANWPQTLEANKQAFIDDWMQRADFRAAYDGLATSAFVDMLISRAGGAFNGDREALVNGLNNGSLSRADALRQIVENEGFVNAKRNEALVTMEYFGYLRRDPDQSGYDFWLNKLNQFNGNFEQAEMVKAFITSGEYRDRFQR